jgi:hypothetical protein
MHPCMVEWLRRVKDPQATILAVKRTLHRLRPGVRPSQPSYALAPEELDDICALAIVGIEAIERAHTRRET